MAQSDDISATEKLLDIIRNEATAPAEEPSVEIDPPDLPVSSNPVAHDPPESATVADRDETAGAASAISSAKHEDFHRPGFFEKMPRPRKIRKPPVRHIPKTLGVDIQLTSISLVKASVTGGQPRVYDFRHSPLSGTAPADRSDLETLLQSAAFKEALKEELIAFCTEPKQCEVWCSLPRECIEIHHLTIPPVPAGEVANVIHWATKKHTSFDEKNTILDFTLLDGENPDGKRTAIAFLAPRHLILALNELFAGFGRSLTGVTTPSICFQNQLKLGWLTAPDSIALLHVEEQSSFIDLFYKGSWIFGREIKTGRRSIVDSIIDQDEMTGKTIDESSALEILLTGAMEGASSIIAADEEEVLTLEQGVPESTAGGIILPATERLVRQLERTFDYCVSTFGTPRATKIYISGQLASSPLFVHSVRAESGLDCEPANPFSVSRKMLRCTLPPQDLKQACVMNTAFGLAFARPLETQNFLNTYQKRISSIQTLKINKMILAGFALLAVLICTLFVFQHHNVNKSKQQLAGIENQLQLASSSGGNVNATKLLQSAREVQGGRSAREKLARKYYIVGLIGEITRLLPERVKLLRLALEPVADNPRKGAARRGPVGKERNQRVVLEGVVWGDGREREFLMGSFLQQLANSSLVEEASFVQKQLATVGGETVLHFTATITPRRPSTPAPAEQRPGGTP